MGKTKALAKASIVPGINPLPEGLALQDRTVEKIKSNSNWFISNETVSSQLGFLLGSSAALAGSIIAAVHGIPAAIAGLSITLSALAVCVGFIATLSTLAYTSFEFATMRNSRLKKLVKYVDFGEEYSPYRNERWTAVKKPSLWSMFNPTRFFKRTVLAKYIKHNLTMDSYDVLTYKGSYWGIVLESETLLGDRAVFRRALARHQRMNPAPVRQPKQVTGSFENKNHHYSDYDLDFDRKALREIREWTDSYLYSA